MDEQNFLILVINLDRSPDRLKSMQKNLDQYECKWTRVQAVEPDPDNFQDDYYFSTQRMKKLSNRHMTRGEFGCGMSHLKVLKEFCASEYDYCLTLEDDVAFLPSTLPFIQEFLSQYGKEAATTWDCLHLSFEYKKRRDFFRKIGDTIIWRNYTFPPNTGAVLWSRVGAEAELKSIERTGIYTSIENQFRYDLIRRGRVLAADPIQIKHLDSASVIDQVSATRDHEAKRRLPYYRYKFYVYFWGYFHQMRNLIKKRS